MKELIPFIIKWNTKTLGITFDDFKLNSQRYLNLSPTRDNYDKLTSEQFELLFNTMYGISYNLNKNILYLIIDFISTNNIWAIKNIIKSINSNYNLKLKDWSETLLWISENQNDELYNNLYNSRLNFNKAFNLSDDRLNDLYRYIMTLK